MYVWMCVRMCIYVCMCVCVYEYVCMYVCKCVYVCTVYIHTCVYDMWYVDVKSSSLKSGHLLQWTLILHTYIYYTYILVRTPLTMDIYQDTSYVQFLQVWLVPATTPAASVRPTPSASQCPMTRREGPQLWASVAVPRDSCSTLTTLPALMVRDRHC